MRFVLPIPPSTNNLYVNAGKRRVKSERYRAWTEVAGQALMLQRMGQGLPPTPWTIDVWLFFATMQKRDADNYNKAVQDLLAEHYGFNDDLITDACQHKRYDRENPRCVVYLRGPDDM